MMRTPLGGLMLCALVHCAPVRASETPDRTRARATILLVARGVKIADETCGSIATHEQDVSLAMRCASAYDVARRALLAAEGGIDAWESSSKRDVACAAVEGARALRQLAAVIRAAGGELPPAVVDALKVVAEIGDICRE